MEIKITALELKNFKGVKDLEINFENVTNIFGKNETGKTSIVDAFTWLLFGKNSEDKKDFDIKPVDGNENVIHGLDTSVMGVFEFNGVRKVYTRTLKEDWVKPRGQLERVFKGNTTYFEINEVPIKTKKEFESDIAKYLDEKTFKLLTSPVVFTNLHWEEQRNILVQLIGGFDDNKVFESSEKMQQLRKLVADESFDNFKKTLAAKRKKYNDEVKSIPIRIDEANESIKEVDEASLNAELNKLQTELEGVEAQIKDKTLVPDETLELKQQRSNVVNQMKDIEIDINNQVNDHNREIDRAVSSVESSVADCKHNIIDANRVIASCTEKSEATKERITKGENQVMELRKEFQEVNSRLFEFDENLCICPTCGQSLPQEDIQNKKSELEANFNKNKTEELQDINSRGKATKEGLVKLKDSISYIESELTRFNELKNKHQSRLEEACKELDEAKAKKKLDPAKELLKNAQYQRLSVQKTELDEKIEKPTDLLSDTTTLETKKNDLVVEIDRVKSELNQINVNKETQERIDKHLDREKKLSLLIAELEQQQFMCEEFTRTKVDMLSSLINDKFSYVNFKLFNQLVNGNVEECCSCTVNGVPFRSVNSAGKINAGLDIIKTLSNFYEFKAPIFVDNRESVNEIVDLDTQVVNLIVTDTDKKLRIEGEK